MKESILKILKSKGESSTLHGLPKILNSQHFILKHLWLICFLGSVCVCSWFLSQSISSYLSYPVVTYTQINNVYQQPFPVFSICNRVDFYDMTHSHILTASFETLKLDILYEFESYTDTYYGGCLRFNSRRSYNGTTVTLKYSNARGREFGFSMSLSSDVIPIIWISNETVSSITEEGVLITPKTLNFFKVHRYSIIKQPEPYSSCLNDLTTIDSYNSECYRKTFGAYNTSYHFSECINMCRQKFFGEKCQLQMNYFGPEYFDSMKPIRIIELNLTQIQCLLKSPKNPSTQYLKRLSNLLFFTSF